jgi:peptidoglycan/xylan/chitin deacetylase (PgdA/CDA1 family)
MPADRDALLAALATQLGVPGEDAGRLGEPMTVAELREMVGHGLEVGSHGITHDSFLQLPADRLAHELDGSRRILQALTGRPVHWLAYPHGDLSDAVARAVELNDVDTDAYQVRRIVLHDGMGHAEFVVAASGLRESINNVLAAARVWLRAPSPGRVRTHVWDRR